MGNVTQITQGKRTLAVEIDEDGDGRADSGTTYDEYLPTENRSGGGCEEHAQHWSDLNRDGQADVWFRRRDADDRGCLNFFSLDSNGDGQPDLFFDSPTAEGGLAEAEQMLASRRPAPPPRSGPKKRSVGEESAESEQSPEDS